MNKVFGYRLPSAVNSPKYTWMATLCCPTSLNTGLARKKHLMTAWGKQTPKAQYSTETAARLRSSTLTQAGLI